LLVLAPAPTLAPALAPYIAPADTATGAGAASFSLNGTEAATRDSRPSSSMRRVPFSSAALSLEFPVSLPARHGSFQKSAVSGGGATNAGRGGLR
jgi:hypothetical protein